MPTLYTSEFTQFLKSFKEEHAGVEQRQLDGRALLWDKAQDSELQEDFRHARVRQQPYVYQND